MLNETTQALINGAFKKKPNLKMTIGVLQGGNTTLKLLEASGEVPYTSYSYEIGSVGKTLTTSLLAKYVESGAMNLDDSVAKYIPKLGDGKYYPTLRRLATHTAGYSSALPMNAKEFRSVAWKQITGKPVSALDLLGMDFDKLITTAHAQVLEDKNYSWQYSNFGMALLGCAVGRAAGMSYADAMTQFLAEALKLPNTIVGEAGAKNLLSGHDSAHRDVGTWNANRDNYTSPAGNFTSTAEDMLEFARRNIEEEPSCLRLCHELHDLKSKHSNMGLGWWIDAKQPSIYYHGGNTDGFASILAFDKQAKTAVVILTNVRNYRQREKLFKEILKTL
ncbi:MAG: beta-lactamase family protein [Oscillospiraceae bacterium]|nr:beta-lactamase family protein [Oscillospiraceae bacterium]